MSTTYKDAGVDIDAADRFISEIKSLVDTTSRPEVVGSLGGFSGLFALEKSRYENPLLVASTDGVGTKLKLAKLMNDHTTVGIDLVAMCVNDIVTTGAEPLFFLDYFATSSLEPVQAKDVVSSIAEGCRQAGCALLGGETAEMPGFYSAGEYDLAGFSVGIVERQEMLGSHRVIAGDKLLGFASSGLHSNGFSLVRKVLVDPDPAALQSRPEELSRSLGRELLEPTRIYVRLVKELLSSVDLHALAHNTGGGLPGNLPRILPEELTAEVRLGSWEIQPVFDLIKRKAAVDEDEMLRTFNMGLGLLAIVGADKEKAAHEVASRHDIDCWTIGDITRRQSQQSRVNLMPPESG